MARSCMPKIDDSAGQKAVAQVYNKMATHGLRVVGNNHSKHQTLL